MLKLFYNTEISDSLSILKKVLLSLAFCFAAVFAKPNFVWGTTGKVTIEKEGKPPTDEELDSARIAISDEYAVVQVSPSVTQVGFQANPVVNAAAAVAAYREEGAEPYLFRMFLPKEVKPKKKYPLILWLHGRAESTSDNQCQLAHMQTSIDVLAGPNRPDFYLVAIQCPVETGSWDKPDPRAPHQETPLEMLDKIIQALVEDYPIDINRISLLGVCSGGAAVFDFVRTFPKRFSAAASLSASTPVDQPHIYRHQPIWLFNNKDDNVKWENSLSFVERTNSAWGDMYITLAETGGHNTWMSAQRDDHIIEWLLLQRRGRFAFPRDVPVLNHSKRDVLRLFVLPLIVFFGFTTASLKKQLYNAK